MLPRFSTTQRVYLALVFCIPLFIVTCKKYEKRAEREKLDNQICSLDKEIEETKDFHTANVPPKLRKAQSQYIIYTDSLNDPWGNIDSCIKQNDSLIAHAFNNYAVRVGRDFQLRKLFPQSDIEVFKQYLACLDSGDFIPEMARQRILSNNGSMHDLSYFLELVDIDSVNIKLQNKLCWHFHCDTVSNNKHTTDTLEISTLEFENQKLNDALHAETNLLNLVWTKTHPKDSLIVKDSLTILDSVANLQPCARNNSLENDTCITINFDIPEFNCIHEQYAHNDSLVKQYKHSVQTVTDAQDSLEQYRQSIIRRRDSLANKRKELGR